MYFIDNNTVVLTAYAFNGLVFCTTRDTFNKLVEAYKDVAISDEYYEQFNTLGNNILPIPSFYETVMNSYVVKLVITSPENYYKHVNEHLTPIGPGKYLLNNWSSTCHYSLKLEDVITIVLAPNSDIAYEKIMLTVLGVHPKHPKN